MLIIGVGNELRGDDAAGIRAARLLAARLEGAELVECAGGCVELLDAWDGKDRVVLLDAAQSGAAPGTVHRFDAMREEIPAQMFSVSSHSLGVTGAVELARELGRLPRELVVYGIEGVDFSHGAAMSPPVQTAIERLVEHIR